MCFMIPHLFAFGEGLNWLLGSMTVVTVAVVGKDHFQTLAEVVDYSEGWHRLHLANVRVPECGAVKPLDQMFEFIQQCLFAA